MTEAKQDQPINGLSNVKIPPKITINFPNEGNTRHGLPLPPPVPDTAVMKKKPEGPVDGEQLIFVRCDRCEKTLGVRIPRKLILENESEIVPVSIVHGKGDSKHVLTVYLDPDFRSRRDKVSDVLFVEY
jgi:hypothetical protein